MKVLERVKGLLTSDAEEDPPTSEEIAERRREVRAEIERLEDELRTLRSDDGRREALAEADSPEELGRRKRLLHDRKEGLEDLDAELVERQREAENRERRENLRDAVEGLPELADELEAARARERKARAEFREALSDAIGAHSMLAVRNLAPEVELPEAHVDRLERLADELPGAFTLDWLRPEDGDDEPERRIVEDVVHEVRYFVGDWSDADPRQVEPAPAGWRDDWSRAEGI